MFQQPRWSLWKLSAPVASSPTLIESYKESDRWDFPKARCYDQHFVEMNSSSLYSEVNAVMFFHPLSIYAFTLPGH